jgi:putative transposase
MRFKVEEIFRILRDCQGGLTGIEVCRKHNISEQTLYRWKRKYGGMELSEAKRMKTLEDENSHLKRMIADLVLECDILREANSKKWRGNSLEACRRRSWL